MIKKLKKLPQEFKDILPTISTIAQALGFRIYLVGGVVRDLLLDRPILDLDIVVEGDAIKLAQEIANYFKVKFRKHHAFGTATVYFLAHKLDFATSRKEIYIHPGALPKVTAAILKDDLFRRDFTINALALSLNKDDYGQVIDYSNGITDLKNGIIRILHNKSFLDDPTRIIRAIRFEQRFSFTIEKNTLKLLRTAVLKGALKSLHRHRLIDEFIHVLKEINPYRYIKRIDNLCGFYFLHKNISINSKDYALLLRIEKAVLWYNKKFPKHRKLDIWLIYFALFLLKLSAQDLESLLHGFALKKGERIRIVSIKDNLVAFKQLSRTLKPYAVYQIIDHLSFESIIFLYAYYPQTKIRQNIQYFLSTLVHIRLKLRGLDLENLHIEPKSHYSRLLERLLEIKMNKGLASKEDEIRALKAIVIK